MVPEEEVAPHPPHRGVAEHMRGFPEVRVHGGADEVGDVGAHAPLRGEVVDEDPALLHQLFVFCHTTRKQEHSAGRLEKRVVRSVSRVGESRSV